MIELKPCPFCNGKAILVASYSELNCAISGYYVRCEDYDCTQRIHKGRASAKLAWNTRTVEDTDDECEDSFDFTDMSYLET